MIQVQHTHFFPTFAMRFWLAPESLECPLAMTTTVSDTFQGNMIFPSYSVKVDDKDFSANLIPLLVRDFNVILGME